MPLDDAERSAILRHLPGADELLRLPMFHRDRARTVDEDQLAGELEAAGVEPADVFVDFERRFGGVGAQGMVLGIHDALRNLRPDSAGGVPCVGGNLDLYFVLRPDGTVWFQDRMSMPTPVRVAERPQSFVFRFLWYLTPRFVEGAQLQLRGHRGAAVADILGAKPVPAASDDVERLWQSDVIWVHEKPDMQHIVDPVDPAGAPDDITSLICDDRETLNEALDAISHLPDLSWRPDDFSDWT